MILTSAKHTLVFCGYNAPNQREATILHQCNFGAGTFHHTAPVLHGYESQFCEIFKHLPDC